MAVRRSRQLLKRKQQQWRTTMMLQLLLFFVLFQREHLYLYNGAPVPWYNGQSRSADIFVTDYLLFKNMSKYI